MRAQDLHPSLPNPFSQQSPASKRRDGHFTVRPAITFSMISEADEAVLPRSRPTRPGTAARAPRSSTVSTTFPRTRIWPRPSSTVPCLVDCSTRDGLPSSWSGHQHAARRESNPLTQWDPNSLSQSHLRVARQVPAMARRQDANLSSGGLPPRHHRSGRLSA